MRDLELGRVMRALRRRRAWRQEDAALRARVHRTTWSLLERGQLDRMTLETVRRCLSVLEVRLDLAPRWRGAALDRLLDDAHATIQAAWAERLRAWGWEVRVEASFNHYGDRGRIDLLAWHPVLHVLLVGEIKSDLVDAQGLLGPLDVKARVAARVAHGLGWSSVAVILPLLIVPDRPTIRRRFGRVAPLFARFTLRGRSAVAALRRPTLQRLSSESGLLIFSNRSSANRGSTKHVAVDRVRLSQGIVSTKAAAGDESLPSRRP